MRYLVTDTTTGEIVHESDRHPYLVLKGTYKAPRRPGRVKAKGSLQLNEASIALFLASLCFGLAMFLIILGLTA